MNVDSLFESLYEPEDVGCDTEQNTDGAILLTLDDTLKADCSITSDQDVSQSFLGLHLGEAICSHLLDITRGLLWWVT